MSKFTLLHETPDHFVVHNGKASFHVAKKGISEPTADKIRSFANGGRTTAGDITQKENQKGMQKIDKKIATQNYADGGQTPEEAGIEAQEKASRAAQTKQSPEEKQIETAAQPDPTDYVKYNNPEKYDDGGTVTNIDPDKAQSISDSFKGAVHSFDDGGEVDSNQDTLSASLKKAFKTPDAQPNRAPASDEDREAEYARIRQQNSQNMQGGSANYAEGGAVASNKVQDISNETQTQAIKRYAAGNPANLDKGGHVHHNAGKNQLHFHFYDGAVVPTQLDKEEGVVPQQPSALDKYVGGEPAQGSPLDNYADGGDVSSSEQAPTDSAKLAQAAQDLQTGLNSQTAPAPDDSATSISASSSPATPDTATVPQSQQIPAVQKPLPPSPDQNPTMLSDFDKALALEKQGIQQGADAQSQGYQQTAQAIGQNVLQQKQMQDAYKLEADKITAQNTQLFNDVASSKIDPNHFWNSKTTGGKIMATIGVILGGIGGGASGTPNQALATLQNHIQEDIDAQKNDQSNKMNLYKMGLERYRDAQSAQQFATLQSNALLQGTLSKIAAQTGNQTAQATAHQMIGQLGVQNAGIRSDLAMKQAAFGAMNQPAQPGLNPDKMRLLVNAGVIPKDEVPAATKEASDYTKLSDTLDHTDNVFKQAAANSTYSERALPGWTPTIRDKSKQYEAVTDAWLGNITKDTEGRVTPADIQLMKASLPKAGDNPDLIQTKLANIKDMIRQKYAFPTLKSYHLIGPNDSVATPAATRQKKFTEGPPK